MNLMRGCAKVDVVMLRRKVMKNALMVSAFGIILSTAAVEPMSFEGMSDEAIAAYKEELYLKSQGITVPKKVLALRSQSFVVRAMSTSEANTDESALARNVVGKQLENGTVEISYDINSAYQCNVSCDISVEGTKLPTPLSFIAGGAIGIVQPGTAKKIIWDAHKDWPNKKSDAVKAILTVTETDAPGDWANIAIEWSEWGGKDIDICGYWLAHTSGKMGYAHTSAKQDLSTAWKSMWKGDNTGSGPENVLVHVANDELGDSTVERQYRIHFNHYGQAASSPHVRVTVNGNGKTLSKVCSAATRRGNAASTSDPYVTITFDESDTPIAID